MLLLTRSKVNEECVEGMDSGIVMVSGVGGYFSDLWKESEYVREYFDHAIEPAVIASIPRNMCGSIAVHIRLGDYPAHWRTDLSWYKAVIEGLQDFHGKVDVQVFSDGKDDELSDILSVPGARRVFYGSAIADIVAISRCRFLIGSDSTFSGWGAFLGNVPCAFAHLHYGRPLEDRGRVFVSTSPDAVVNWAKAVIR